MKYAGIGSRETPNDILLLMESLALNLNEKGYLLRSGGAIGADSAFERGSTNKEIFKANHATQEAIKLAEQFHPNWNACNDYVRKLHGRNSMIILGKNLDDPVKFVICWTKNGKDIGGTGLGIRLAEKRGITTYNLYYPVVIQQVWDLIKTL